MSNIPPFTEIAETMQILPDLDERYEYLIQLGGRVEALPEEEKTDEVKVRGCQSSVWLLSDADGSQSPPAVTFRGESDAKIVNGLVAILLSLYQDKNAEEILALDAEEELAKLQLEHYLSPSRKNGLAKMVERARRDATEALLAHANS